MIDLAKRAYDHGFKFDPIVRNLGDTDFYKLLMLQFIWLNYRNTDASLGLKNRTKKVHLADDVDIDELRRQLEHVQTLKWENNFLIWLAGNTFYGQTGIFDPEFLEFLRNDFALSTFSLSKEVTRVPSEFAGIGPYPADHTLRVSTGQLEVTFMGSWVSTTLWEIYVMTITNELRYRKKMSEMSKSRLDIMYARAKVKLYAKLERLNTLPELAISDFGTRRRHSFLWQEYCVLMAKEVLGSKFSGTSNAYLAFKHGLNAIGTNAHELPMVLAAKETTYEGISNAQYKVLEQWQETYRGNLLVFLPDTFGTTQFLKNAPEWVDNWVGGRPDSKKPATGGEELISWWEFRGQNPTEKKIIFADGLDVRIPGYEPQGTDIIEIYNQFHGRVIDLYGLGTMFTNDFIGCDPEDPNNMGPISIVCKVISADGHPAVKLSDNYTKATGDEQTVQRYRDIFGHEGMENAPVVV